MLVHDSVFTTTLQVKESTEEPPQYAAERRRLEAKIRQKDRIIRDLQKSAAGEGPRASPNGNAHRVESPEEAAGIRKQNFELMATIVDLEMTVSKLQKDRKQLISEVEAANAAQIAAVRGQHVADPRTSRWDRETASHQHVSSSPMEAGTDQSVGRLRQQLRQQMDENLHLQRELLKMNSVCVKLEKDKALMKVCLAFLCGDGSLFYVPPHLNNV